MHGKSTLVLLALTLLMGFSWQTAQAAEAWRQHTETLPSYCAYRVTPEGKANRAGRYPSLRPVWIHIHHYCAGIYAENQAKISIDKRKKKTYLEDVVHQMYYVGEYCGPRCVLYPELHTRWGWALKELGRIGDAVMHLQAAIKAKPDYSRGYAELADLYAETNQPDLARKTLEEGLKNKPKSRMLKRRLERLNDGGR